VSAAVPDNAEDSAKGGAPALVVNGEARPLGDGTLTGLLEAEAVDFGARGLAVAVNGQVVPRHAWGTTQLAPGDEVEIVKLFAGG
jgi:sulfur carrier protein